ncbi:MAG: hypothetical protein OXF30_01790 [Candidatus Saccharibacteria bacterium]|nr:hypothetical protein [Candidatus Saccharibacteria bacterium]
MLSQNFLNEILQRYHTWLSSILIDGRLIAGKYVNPEDMPHTMLGRTYDLLLKIEVHFYTDFVVILNIRHIHKNLADKDLSSLAEDQIDKDIDFGIVVLDQHRLRAYIAERIKLKKPIKITHAYEGILLDWQAIITFNAS